MAIEMKTTEVEICTPEKKDPSPDLVTVQSVIKAYRDKAERDKESARERVRLLNRTKYRNDRIKAGLPVRDLSKHDIAPQQPGESLSDYQRRAHRLRQLSYRGRKPEDVRPRADLSGMSEAEKAEHKRLLACERKRKSRALKGNQKTTDAVLTEAELQELAHMDVT